MTRSSLPEAPGKARCSATESNWTNGQLTLRRPTRTICIGVVAPLVKSTLDVADGRAVAGQGMVRTIKQKGREACIRLT